MGPRSPSSPRAAAVLVTFTLAMFAVPAAGAPAAARTSSLAWVRADGADTCIGGKELAEAVEQILGRRVFVSASAADVAVEGHVDKVASGWKATLRISDEHGALLGSRELESQPADCRAMDPSLAFVIAVMIDPDAAARPPAPLAPPAPATPPVAPPAPTPRNDWTIAPRVGVSAALGELPSAALGASLGLRFGPPAVGVDLFGAYFLPQTEGVAGAGAASAQFTFAYAGAAICPTLLRRSTLALVGCAGGAAGFLAATPNGLAGEQGSTNFGAMATLRARAEWRFASVLFAVGELGADVPFERPTWNVTYGGAASAFFRPAAVAGEAGVSLGLTID
jgi:hypothetical protein